MFSSPITGDTDATATVASAGDYVTAATLLNYVPNSVHLETQTTAQQALTQATGNAETINALDQRLTAALSGKVSSTQLTAYALVSSLESYGTQADVSAANTVAQNALTTASGLQANLNLQLLNKADQSALEALALEVAGRVSNDALDARLLGFVTTSALNSNLVTSNNALRTELAALYATKAQVDPLVLQIADKAHPNDIAVALLPYPTSEKGCH